MFDSDFLTGSPQSHAAYQEAMQRALGILNPGPPAQPYSGKTPAALGEVLTAEILPESGNRPEDVWQRVAKVVANSVVVTHAYTAAHLQCPPLISSLAAEAIIDALNQSMDSFDQAPAATILEQALVNWLCGEAALPAAADGIFTTGGTQSNYMALMLARDACLQSRWNWSAQRRGLPPEAGKLRILCSEVAHFTVEKSAAQLGLGTSAVIRLATDESFRMRPQALQAALEKLQTQEMIPMAIVATAGTTDFGSIDPLPQIAACARAAKAWLHVDAAYGGALLFSHRHRSRLKGIEGADSVSIDFHKLLWQPISCAALLLADGRQFGHLKFHADYLNPELHEDLGIPNLVTKSLATTRRFDALKVWVSFQMLGRKKLGEMIDYTIDLASYAAYCVGKNPRFELVHKPSLSCVVFRYRTENPAVEPDSFNAVLRQRLFEEGVAVIGHTVVRGKRCLKLTCLNPTASKAQIEDLVALIAERGQQLEWSATRNVGGS